MKRTSLVALSVALGLAALSAGAKSPVVKPPVSGYEGTLDPQCSCDWAAGQCTASWNDLGYLGVLNLVYGAEIEFEASWIETVTLEDGTTTQVKRQASAEADLDDTYACDGTTCSATAGVLLPEYPADAEVSFEALVKAFEDGKTGQKPRNFAKDEVACPLPE
jgi:hypothetical protein